MGSERDHGDRYESENTKRKREGEVKRRWRGSGRDELESREGEEQVRYPRERNKGGRWEVECSRRQ